MKRALAAEAALAEAQKDAVYDALGAKVSALVEANERHKVYWKQAQSYAAKGDDLLVKANAALAEAQKDAERLLTLLQSARGYVVSGARHSNGHGDLLVRIDAAIAARGKK